MEKKQHNFEMFMREYFPDQSLTITREFPNYASYVTYMIATAWNYLYSTIEIQNEKIQELNSNIKDAINEAEGTETLIEIFMKENKELSDKLLKFTPVQDKERVLELWDELSQMIKTFYKVIFEELGNEDSKVIKGIS